MNGSKIVTSSAQGRQTRNAGSAAAQIGGRNRHGGRGGDEGADMRAPNSRSPGPAPFSFTLAADIQLAPKAYIVDGFVGAAEVSAWYVAAGAAK